MKIDELDPKHIIAEDEDKVLRQISSGIILGYEVWLRKVVIDGVEQDDFIENYEEIDKPEPPVEDINETQTI